MKINISCSHNQNNWFPVKTTPVFDTYWRFAAERQAIFFRRFHGESAPWTEDPILLKYKFTNAYRASDRVSQYLIRNVIFEGDLSEKEIFFRIILFKIFNKIETWKLLKKEFGIICWEDFCFNKYDSVLSNAMKSRKSIYSAAYIMPSGSRAFGHKKKHKNHLELIQKMMKDDLPQKVCGAQSMQAVFELLRAYPMIGDFLAYQYATDINYSNLTDFSEMSFVVPGPGAKDGIRKCFSDLCGLNEVDIIKLMVDRQEKEFERLYLKFQTLWGRRLQLIDCQNLFCEVGKYARIAHPEIVSRTGRKRIKQKYRITNKPIDFFYPQKWGIGDKIHNSQKKSIM